MALAMATNSSNPESVFNTVTMGYLSKSVAGASDITLTDAEARNAVHEYTGALTGNIAVIVPAEAKPYSVFNNTSGAYTLTVKTSGGSGIAVTQGKKVLLVCDGTNVVQWSAEYS